METYDVAEPLTSSSSLSRKQKVLRLLSAAGLNFVGFFIINRIWNFFCPWQTAKEGLVEALMFGVFMGSVSPWTDKLAAKKIIKRFYPYQLIVTESEMIGVSPKSRHTVRKGRIRSVSDRPNSLVVSEHGRVCLFFLGGVTI